MDKRGRRSPGAAEPGPQAAQPEPALALHAPAPPALRAEHHGPRRPRRRPPRSPAAPRRAAAAARARRRPARSSSDLLPGAPVVSELRCHCLQTVQGIHLKNIESVKVTSPGAHCAQTEVIATLKNGQEACLNPAAPMVKKMLQKMLNRESSKLTEREGGSS
ncbi:uncharacterized protein LOC143668227 [Tamandua tetradactyla]|uniref:uncharacterized protein LOC143668227 n=1 Tax=Tamandua tetradactyla TaxID=48850 RepID=UPI0040543885